MSSLQTFLVNLVLLCPDEGAFVDIGMYFDIRVIAEFESVLLNTINEALDVDLARRALPTCCSLQAFWSIGDW